MEKCTNLGPERAGIAGWGSQPNPETPAMSSPLPALNFEPWLLVTPRHVKPRVDAMGKQRRPARHFDSQLTQFSEAHIMTLPHSTSELARAPHQIAPSNQSESFVIEGNKCIEAPLSNRFTDLADLPKDTLEMESTYCTASKQVNPKGSTSEDTGPYVASLAPLGPHTPCNSSTILDTSYAIHSHRTTLATVSDGILTTSFPGLQFPPPPNFSFPPSL